MLAGVREAGYEGIEIMGDHLGTLGTPSALAAKLDAAGLTAAAVATLVETRADDANTAAFRSQLDYAGELGITTVMVCGGWLGEATQRRTALEEDYAGFARNLERAMADAAGRGQRLAFHPHTGCIVETRAEVARLLAHVPELDLCVDTGHLAAVREDPAALVDDHPDKVVHVHLKDYDSRTRFFTEPGRGDVGLDLPKVFAALQRAGYAGWVVAELDRTSVPPDRSAADMHAVIAPLAG
jgi:inosose dehydratase